MKKYSLIIPTIWASKIIKESINDYQNSSYIEEIIIIDNNPKHQERVLFNDRKTTQIAEENNIYVNPAWNKGVAMSRSNYLIFANDDIHIHDIDSLLQKMEDLNWDLAGINLKNSNIRSGIEYRRLVNGERRREGFGCFFLMKKSSYVQIPESIKIWYGDDIQFNNAKNKYIFSVPLAKFELSKSVNSDSNFQKIIESDKENYSRYIQGTLS